MLYQTHKEQVHRCCWHSFALNRRISVYDVITEYKLPFPHTSHHPHKLVLKQPAHSTADPASQGAFPPIRGHISPTSISNPPLIKPLKVSPLLMLSLHAKDNSSEKHKHPNHHGIQNPINRPLQSAILPRQRPRHPIEHKA